MWGGSLSFDTPMLWSIGFLTTFLFGGLTGIILASPPLDFHVSDSYFVVAHFHYVVFGTVVFAMFAGLLLLVAEDDRPDARRAARQAALLAAVRRLPHHVPGPALAGRRGHAASLRRLPARGRLHHAQPGLDGRRVPAGRLDAAVPLQRLHLAQGARWSRSTTRGAGAARWSGRPAARRRATTSYTIPRIRSESPAFDLHHPEIAALELAENDAEREGEPADAPTWRAARRCCASAPDADDGTDEERTDEGRGLDLRRSRTIFFVLVTPAYWFIDRATGPAPPRWS